MFNLWLEGNSLKPTRNGMIPAKPIPDLVSYPGPLSFPAYHTSKLREPRKMVAPFWFAQLNPTKERCPLLSVFEGLPPKVKIPTRTKGARGRGSVRMDVFLGGNPQHGSGFPFDPRQKDKPREWQRVFSERWALPSRLVDMVPG